MRDYTCSGEPLWYLDHGSRSLGQHNHDNTVVVRWVLRERGVVLSGPEPETLVDPIPVDVRAAAYYRSYSRLGPGYTG